LKKAVFNWSGGKDSALCLYKVLQQKEYEVVALLTSVSESQRRVSMHGFKIELLFEQAESIGIPLHIMYVPDNPSMEDYEKAMNTALQPILDMGIEYSIFGDIFLEDLRQYREDKLALVNLKGVFPLWNIDTTVLINEFIELGFKTITTCINEQVLTKEFVGREIDANFVNELPENVDPCGENGEFHTFVFDGPIFKKEIKIQTGEVVRKTYPSPNKNEADFGFWYCDIIN